MVEIEVTDTAMERLKEARIRTISALKDSINRGRCTVSKIKPVHSADIDSGWFGDDDKYVFHIKLGLKDPHKIIYQVDCRSGFRAWIDYPKKPITND